MGLFFRKRLPTLDDPRLRDFGFLLQPITVLYSEDSWALDVDTIGLTVANRLAHLTTRMEQTPNIRTAVSARWYLDNLVDVDILNVPRAQAVLDPIKRRLELALADYQNHTGAVIDTWQFGKLVGQTEHERCVVLYGPPLWRDSDDAGGALGPRGPLSSWLTFNCWKFALFGPY